MDFCSFFSRFSDVEKIARFLGGEKSVEGCHVSGCHGSFSPDIGQPLRALP